MPTREDLKYYQSLPLELKIAKTKDNIRECVREYSTDGLWKPNDKGLGLRHVFDTLNGIYGKDFIRYE